MNPLLNTFLRSLVLMGVLVYVLDGVYFGHTQRQLCTTQCHCMQYSKASPKWRAPW